VHDLFNVSYEVLLQTLGRYFAHTEESSSERATLANVTVGLMFQVIKPLGNLITTLPVGPSDPDRTAGPSFELFYESDYLFPHRDAAWTLLEERLREAAAFCDRIRSQAPGDIASGLEPIGSSVLRLAQSLGDVRTGWGLPSHADAVTDGRHRQDAPAARDETEPEVQPERLKEDERMDPPDEGETVSFAAHIKGLFRERDRQSMEFAFDLWSYEDVKAHARPILDQLRAGTMPCDGAWSGEKIDTFQRWIDAGMTA